MTIYYGAMDKGLVSYDASIKPRVDIESILSDTYLAKPIHLPIFKWGDKVRNSSETLTKQFNVMSKADTLVLQVPMYVENEFNLVSLAKHTGAKLIGLVHDIEYLRGFSSEYDSQLDILSLFDSLIVESANTIDWLNSKGINADMSVMEFWPYLLPKEVELPVYSNNINYAGNLSRLPYSNITNLSAYGNANDEEKANLGSRYKGAFLPEELPYQYKSGYGLVWYSDSAYQNYAKTYAAPHKASAYLSAGLPIIYEEGSSIESTMKKLDAGIAIKGIDNIEETVASIDETCYNKLVGGSAVLEFSVTNGVTFIKALNKLL